MNIIADPRSTKTADFTYQFVPFPTTFGRGYLGHFFVPPVEAPVPTPEKGLAAGVLKQAAHDLRRFRGATKGFRRELYLDAHSWITANDFSWPYSFVNVCKLLDVSPDVIRAEVLDDASLGWLDYWTARASRLSGKLRTSFVDGFASCRNLERAGARHLPSCI